MGAQSIFRRAAIVCTLLVAAGILIAIVVRQSPDRAAAHPQPVITSEAVEMRQPVADGRSTVESVRQVAPPADSQWNPVPEPIDSIWDDEIARIDGGDMDAAYDLGRQLIDCATFRRTVPNRLMFEAIRRLGATSEPDRVAEFEALYFNCDTSDDRLQSGPDWVIMAADAGHLEAQEYFGHGGWSIFASGSEDTRAWFETKRIDYWQRARKQGSRNATLSLAFALKDTDPVASLANATLLDRMLQHEPNVTAETVNQQSHTAALASVASQRLTEAQLLEASQLTDAWFDECCR